jgi:uncharacterized protein (DUF1778 family)
MAKKTKRFELRLTPDEAKILRKVSKKRGLSMSEVFVAWLRKQHVT